MTTEYNNAISEFGFFIESLKNRYDLPDTRGTITGMMERLQKFGDVTKPFHDEALDKANELIETITDLNEQDLFTEQVKEIAAKAIKDLFEGN